MRFMVFVLFLGAVCFGDTIDFGVQGKQYPIIEENGIDFIKRRTKEIDKKKLELELEEKIKKLSVSNVQIPNSNADVNITSDDIYLAKWDIRDPISGNVVYNKGSQIPTKMQKGERLELCFVDGHLNKAVINKIIADFGKKCTYFVNKKNVFDFQKEYGVKSYPMGGQNLEYIERYNVKVLPTKITRYLDKKTTRTLNIKRLAIDVMEGRK